MGDMTEQERLAFQAQAMGVPVPAQPAPPPPAPVAASAQQSSDPNAPNYINPQSPYYKSPTARGAIQLGNAAPPQAAPPVDPNKYAQQSDDPNAPGYVNPQSPFYNPHAPKPVAVEPAAPAKPEPAPMGPPKPPAVKFASTSASPAESGGASATPSINWGGAGGGTATISAHEVPLASKGRQNEVLGAIDNQVSAIEDQKAAIRGSGEAAANIAEQEAAGKRDIAKATADAGAETTSRAKLHADESKAFRAHIDNFAAKLATDKIDPNAMWNNSSTGQKITWTLAKAFGAIGQAFLHTSTNQIADHIEAMAAQDVAGQRANHEIGRE